MCFKALNTSSLVPYTFIEYEANSNLRPEVRQLYDMVDRYQLVNSYGLFRRMTGVGGRPEVMVEGSYDGQKWKEIEFMYKPGNLSVAPPLVAPHQPRLDWQMWFAALGDHRHSPWFTSFIHRLLQGKRNVIRLVQVDETKYAFSTKPPTYIRAQLYKYWYTMYGTDRAPDSYCGSGRKGSDEKRSWGTGQDKMQPKRVVKAILPSILKLTREQVEPYSGEQVIWGLFIAVLFISLLKALTNRKGSTLKPGSRRPERKDMSG
eukprot:g39578.t1